MQQNFHQIHQNTDFSTTDRSATVALKKYLLYKKQKYMHIIYTYHSCMRFKLISMTFSAINNNCPVYSKVNIIDILHHHRIINDQLYLLDLLGFIQLLKPGLQRVYRACTASQFQKVEISRKVEKNFQNIRCTLITLSITY